MAVKISTKAMAALQALKALQGDAKRKGLDKMTIEEINTEIAVCRQEKHLKKRPSQKTR